MDKFEKTVNEIRKFNRFYTVNMGFLNLDYLNMEYSIVETRILFEIITLTEKGNTETEKLIELTNHQIRDQISKLDSDECDKLCNAMNTVISILRKGE